MVVAAETLVGAQRKRPQPEESSGDSDDARSDYEEGSDDDDSTTTDASTASPRAKRARRSPLGALSQSGVSARKPQQQLIPPELSGGAKRSAPSKPRPSKRSPPAPPPPPSMPPPSPPVPSWVKQGINVVLPERGVISRVNSETDSVYVLFDPPIQRSTEQTDGTYRYWLTLHADATWKRAGSTRDRSLLQPSMADAPSFYEGRPRRSRGY